MACSNPDLQSEKPIELIVITVNYQGQDIPLEVDYETANILLNDQVQAEKYVRSIFLTENNATDEEPEGDTDLSPMDLSDTELTKKASTSSKVVWTSKGTPSQYDIEASEFLLKRYDYYKEKFRDQKTNKTTLWTKIASELENEGFSLGEKSQAWVRCRQKFNNMMKAYISFRDHQNSTGKGKKDPPMFFELLHGILGDKHKCAPNTFVKLQDSEQDTEKASASENAVSDSEENNSTADVKNRFAKKRVIQPKSFSSKLLVEIRNQHETTINLQTKQFDDLKEILTEQNKQRDKMLELLSDIVKKDK